MTLDIHSQTDNSKRITDLAQRGSNIGSYGLKGVQYAAHRGLSKIAPENTLPAFIHAGNAGFWGAETDVQLSLDGEWVLMHDATVDRTTNGTGAVDSLTLAQLKILDAGSWFSDYYVDARVPTLLEYLQTCKRAGLIPVPEIKTGTYSDTDLQYFIDQCLSVFGDYQFTILSANQGIVGQLRDLDKRVTIEYVVGAYTEALVDFCVTVGNCWLGAEYTTIPSDVIYATSRGVQIVAFTVNDPDNIVDMINAGVRQITTDYINLP